MTVTEYDIYLSCFANRKVQTVNCVVVLNIYYI